MPRRTIDGVPVPRRVAELRSSAGALIGELSKFGVVGFVNLGIDIAMFNLFNQVVGLGPLTSKVLATCISATSAYFMHRHWSFAHRARTGVRREYLLFFALNAIALGIGLAVIAAVRYGLGLDSALWLNLANLVGIVFGTVFRYLAYKRWVFPAVPVAEAAAEPVAEPAVPAPPG